MAKESSIALILGGNKKKGSKENLMGFDPEEDMGEEVSGDDAFEDAASSVLQAIQEVEVHAHVEENHQAPEPCLGHEPPGREPVHPER